MKTVFVVYGDSDFNSIDYPFRTFETMEEAMEQVKDWQWVDQHEGIGEIDYEIREEEIDTPYFIISDRAHELLKTDTIDKETFFALSSIAETNGGDAFFGNYHFSNKDGISVFVETMSEYLNRN